MVVRGIDNDKMHLFFGNLQLKCKAIGYLCGGVSIQNDLFISKSSIKLSC